MQPWQFTPNEIRSLEVLAFEYEAPIYRVRLTTRGPEAQAAEHGGGRASAWGSGGPEDLALTAGVSGKLRVSGNWVS